jgi:hypothetical protein
MDAHEPHRAGIPEDPRPLLRLKVVDEDKTPEQIADELGWPLDEVHRLLSRHRRHLATARTLHRFGRYLSRSYPELAINVFFQFLGVMLGFAIGTAIWPARVAELADLRAQLAVLRPLLAEINVLHQRTVALQRAAPPDCQITFAFPRWESISVSEGALLLEDQLFNDVRKTYQELALASENAKGMDQTQCQAFLGDLGERLVATRNKIVSVVRTAEGQRNQLRGQLQMRGLVRFLLGVVALSLVGLLIPVGLYRVGLLLTRTGR